VKPVGLFTDTETGMIGVVTKTGLNYIEPCHIIDRLYLDPPLDPRNAIAFLLNQPEMDDGECY
jgi:hypothetical protein